MQIPSPVDLTRDFIQKFITLLHKHDPWRSQRLAKMPAKALNQAYEQMERQVERFNKGLEASLKNVKEKCLQIMIKGSHVRIEVETHKLKSALQYSNLIEGKVIFSRPGYPISLSVDCVVACGHWHKLEDLKESKINLIDHLEKLLPPKQSSSSDSKGPVGLVTFQNGIQNNWDKFEQMGQTIVNLFPEGPLCIGIHNPTTHFLPTDMLRFTNEPEMNPVAVYSLCQMMKTFADLLPKINPKLVWAHFAHSEGGLIANAALDLSNHPFLTETQRSIKSQLITYTYGAVKPISSDPVMDAINTYSDRDIALFFGENFLDRSLDQIQKKPFFSSKQYSGKTYKIVVIDSILPNDPLVKIQLEMPEIKTLEERLKLSWLEMLGYQEELNNTASIFLNKLAIDKINETTLSIVDHGFKNATYQEALKDNIKGLRKGYKIYEGKRDR